MTFNNFFTAALPYKWTKKIMLNKINSISLQKGTLLNTQLTTQRQYSGLQVGRPVALCKIQNLSQT